MSKPDDVAKEVIDQATAESKGEQRSEAGDRKAADKAAADKAASDKVVADLTTERDALKTERDALKTEVDRLEKLTAKPPAAVGGGEKKLTADEWLAEELKKGK